jgi:hypothetical protein|tara:strand:+ start:445 stop:1077 length:633 start_codon:yes stop_codon:yes gene_type:complete
MSKGEIIDFVVLRITTELDKFQRTKTIPHTLLEGAIEIDEIRDVYYDQLPAKYQKILNQLLKEYDSQVIDSIESMKLAMKKDYARVIKNMSTEHDSFIFKEIMNSYRPGINPIRALYYQAREVVRRYNPEDPSHYWLIDLITDLEFNNIILDALGTDVKKLEKIIKRYYFPLTKHGSGIPLELFHAKQQLKDFRHYYQFFRNLKDWQPDE